MHILCRNMMFFYFCLSIFSNCIKWTDIVFYNNKRLLTIKCGGTWVSLIDWKVELSDGVKATEGPKGR